MTDVSSYSLENIIGSTLAGLVIAYLGIKKYMQEWKAPTSPTGDRVIPGLSIADMQPIRDCAIEQARTAAACERIATALERQLALFQERADDEELLRRAEIIAQDMIKHLPVSRRPKRPTRP